MRDPTSDARNSPHVTDTVHRQTSPGGNKGRGPARRVTQAGRMQVSDQDREPSQRERNRSGIADGSDELRPLARRIAELRERRRWLGKETAFVDCRIAEARFERGQLRGRGGRKRRHGDALSNSLTQLSRQRDSLVRQLDAAEIDIGFEIVPAARAAWDAVAESFNALRRCNGIANLPAPETDSRRRGPRQASVPERPLLFPPPERWEVIRSEVAPLHLRNGAGEDLLFFPGFLLVNGKEGQIGLIDLRDIRLSILDAPSPVPAARPVSGEAGGVSTLPVAQRVERAAPRPARLLLTSDTGLREVFDIGDRKRCGAFVDAMGRYQSSLPNEDAFVIADPDPAERLPSLEIPERLELPALPPRSRWPVMVASLAAGAVLLLAADQATPGGAFNRLLGGVGAALSAATDRIAGLLDEEPPANETETADANSATGDAIGTTLREAEPTPPQENAIEVAPLQPETAPVLTSAQPTPPAPLTAPEPPTLDPEIPVPSAGPSDLNPRTPALAVSPPVQPMTPPAPAAGVDPELAAEPDPQPGVQPESPSSPAPDTTVASLPEVAEPTEASVGEVETPPTQSTKPTKPTEPAAIAVPFVSTAPELAPSEIAALQRTLQILGFRPGSADGVAGRRTLAAVQEFQQRRGLPKTVAIDRRTLELVLAEGSPQPSFPKPFVPSAFVPSPFTTTVSSPAGVGQLRTYPWPYANVPRPLTASERGR